MLFGQSTAAVRPLPIESILTATYIDGQLVGPGPAKSGGAIGMGPMVREHTRLFVRPG